MGKAKQIYTIVNSVANQALGSEALTIVDETGLIALGNLVLSSQSNTNSFIEALIDRIGKTIISYRKYENKFKGLVRTDFEMGAVLQKIKVQMPEAEIDESHDLVDGESIDQYKVAKGEATQKLFDNKTPYQCHITIHKDDLKEAFTSEGMMESFYSARYGEVQNFLEFSLERMGRNCLNNFAAEVAGSTREIKLLTEYKKVNTGAVDMTAQQALRDTDFLKFASQRIQKLSSLMTEMTKGVFNDGTTTRHTPKSMQRMYILKDFSQALETNVLANAFNKEYDEIGDYQDVNYWQALQEPSSINVTKASGGAKKVTNMIGMLLDYEAAGVCKTQHTVDNSPYNAAGRYWNVYWHEIDMYFNDLSENGLILTLN